MIGIMADSHGKLETIEACLEKLRGMNCRRIYHLGDVCDSTRPETVEACLRPLREHDVVTLKGNNEQAIVANHSARENTPVPKRTLAYLQKLPLVQYYQDAIFAHSLPFDRELGLACMIGAMGPNELRRFFGQYPQRVLFRGHGHSPELVCRQGQHIETIPLSVGDKIDLRARRPCVVTCGAASNGFFMAWNPQAKFVECFSVG